VGWVFAEVASVKASTGAGTVAIIVSVAGFILMSRPFLRLLSAIDLSLSVAGSEIIKVVQLDVGELIVVPKEYVSA